MVATTSHGGAVWWMFTRWKTGVVYLQGKLCECDPYLSASEVRFLRRGAIQIFSAFNFLDRLMCPQLGRLAVNGKKRLMRLTIRFHFHDVQYHGAVTFSMCFCCRCQTTSAGANYRVILNWINASIVQNNQQSNIDTIYCQATSGIFELWTTEWYY